MKTYKSTFFIRIFFIGSFLYSQGGLTLKNDNAQVEEDGAVSINVLKNDNIKDKSNLILEVVEEPKLGTAEVQGKKIMYTPNLDQNGVDEFKYKADIGTASGIAQVRVNINAVNDPPKEVVINTNSIDENTAAGTIIGKLDVVDPDIKDTYKYSLARDNKDDFSLDGSNLLSKRPYDFEKNSSYTLSIQVTDSGNESIVGSLVIEVKDVNEAPILVSKRDMKVKHSEDLGKIITRIEAKDLDAGQENVKYRLSKTGEDNGVFKITRSGDLSFLKIPDYENPLDKDKDNIYNVSYNVLDSKSSKLFVSGIITVTLMDAIEREVKTMDKRKFIAWTIDHQPYHILMEDAIQDYIKMNYTNDSFKEKSLEDDGTYIAEMRPTDEVIMVQKKGNSDEIHEIWYGNGLDYTVIDREKVDWIFSQDIQKVLIDRDQYLTSNSETVFHESESQRLMAGYGSQFSVWHANNFKMSLSTFSIRSNLLQYATNMRVGNPLIGLPGLLAGSSEFGIATQRSEFGFRLPFAFDFTTGNYDEIDVPTADYLGLYARGNIDNLFGTKTNFHALFGFTFYPSSTGEKLTSLNDLGSQASIADSVENLNILDSYALAATTINVPIKLSFIGRLTASPGFHYLKVAHRIKDKRKIAINSGQDIYERTFYREEVLNEGNSFTRLSSFYIRFDLLGKIGEKPNLIEKISFFDFIQLSTVPFYEISFQYISGLNMLTNLNLNFSDQIGISFTSLSKNSELGGNWMPESKFWFGLQYRANF